MINTLFQLRNIVPLLLDILNSRLYDKIIRHDKDYFVTNITIHEFVFVLRITISLQNIKVWFANDLDSVSEIISANHLLLIINNFTNKQIKFSKMMVGC